MREVRSVTSSRQRRAVGAKHNMCWSRKLASSEKLAESEKSEKITMSWIFTVLYLTGFQAPFHYYPNCKIFTILYLIDSQGETP